MDSDKPSIAGLLRVATQPGDPTQMSMLLRADVALALLEIAAAALAWADARKVPGVATEREAAHELIRVLTKVGP